ncbi:TonB-dependent receptor [Alishewanella sp. d11]|uniref:TonB-dependent receptor n=1 Tax=Alishewanella sp. d11 TaxID=3414030 RepID=UPI003BF92096
MSAHSSYPALAYKPRYLALAISLALLPAIAQAEETIERIQVEGQQHSALQLQQLDAEQLSKLIAATSDTASLLSQLAGVSINQTGAVSSLPMIRGLSDDRLRVKVDGMDLISACPNHMNPPLSYMAPSEVGQITVFAGITPVSVGGDSIGGSIITESKAPEFNSEQSLSGEWGGYYRSNNQAIGTHFNLSHSSEQLFVSYNGNWSQGDNYKAAENFKTIAATGRPDHALALDEVASSAFKTQNHNLRLALQLADDLFDVQLSYQDMPKQLFPNQRMDLLDNQQFRINANWQQQRSWGHWQSRFYHENIEHKMDFGPDRQFWYGSNAMGGRPCEPIRFAGDPAGTCAAGMPMYSDATNTGLSLSAEVQTNQADIMRIGAEYQQFRLDDYWTASGGGMGPGTFLNINDGKRDRLAVFAEHEHHLSEKWLLLYGARVEQVKRNADEVTGYSTAANAPGMQVMDAARFNQGQRSNTDTNLDLTLLSRYQLTAQTTLELGVAQKMRSANLYEAYPWSYWAMAASMNNLVGDGNGYVGNVALNPEKAHTFSASINWQSANQQQQIRFTPYVTRVKDYIDAVAANANWQPNQYNILQYQNQHARLMGADLSWKTQLAEHKTGVWQLDGTLSYIDAKNTDTDSGLYNVVPWQGRISLTHRLAGWDNSLEWQLVSSKNRVSAIRNEQTTGGYGLLNLRLSHSWQQLRLDLGVENILDKFYYLPQGGTYVGQGMTMSINGIPFGIGVPGMGRTVYAGFNLSF